MDNGELFCSENGPCPLQILMANPTFLPGMNTFNMKKSAVFNLSIRDTDEEVENSAFRLSQPMRETKEVAVISASLPARQSQRRTGSNPSEPCRWGRRSGRTIPRRRRWNWNHPAHPPQPRQRPGRSHADYDRQGIRWQDHPEERGSPHQREAPLPDERERLHPGQPAQAGHTCARG
jgi:hypothetical protein